MRTKTKQLENQKGPQLQQTKSTLGNPKQHPPKTKKNNRKTKKTTAKPKAPPEKQQKNIVK